MQSEITVGPRMLKSKFPEVVREHFQNGIGRPLMFLEAQRFDQADELKWQYWPPLRYCNSGCGCASLALMLSEPSLMPELLTISLIGPVFRDDRITTSARP